jgi:hypothetical protein
LLAAEEAKARIEFETKPDAGVHRPATGWVDLTGQGKKIRFEEEISTTADGWAFGRTLTLISKDEPTLLHLDWDNWDVYYPPFARWSCNADDPLYTDERDFLETLKYAYGYISDEDILSQADDPKFAVHLWARDNGMIAEGRMTIRRYKGQPDWLAKEEHTVEDGPITYALGPRGLGIWAYDRQADEHFIVFHANSWHCVVGQELANLAKVDSWLLFTTGEQWGKKHMRVVAVNVEDYYLKRLDLRPTDVPRHETIDVTDSRILISSFRIERPIRRTGERFRPWKWTARHWQPEYK